jgi:diguanylate cyclase (GGDEF)-like protein
MPAYDPVLHVLHQWSLGVQFCAALLLACFFVALSRSVRLREVRLWAQAWVSDAAAIGAVFLLAFAHPPWLAARFASALYAACKTVFALLLVAGARYYVRPGAEIQWRPRQLALVVTAWGLALSFLAPRFGPVQFAESLMVGTIITVGGVWVLRFPRSDRSNWLGWALLAQGVLFLHYVPLLAPTLWGGRPLASYLGISSFFDAGAELVVALATLVALEASTTEHLRHLNEELVASQDRLRQLADLDPLTNLANRRSLRATLARVSPGGAALIFLDIRDFKGINDRFGHIVGDSCLRRLASTLSEVFRTDDALFRYGGDEFLVVAPGLDQACAAERVGTLRARLAESTDQTPRFQIAAGIAVIPQNGEPDAALRDADSRMVADKQAQKSAAPSSAQSPA